MQAAGSGQSQMQYQLVATQQSVNVVQRPIGTNQCCWCRRWGHCANECPSPYNVGMQGGRGYYTHEHRGGRRGGRGGGGAGFGQPSNVNVVLQVSDAGAPGPSMQ